jgi:hypothetical protein
VRLQNLSLFAINENSKEFCTTIGGIFIFGLHHAERPNDRTQIRQMDRPEKK